MIEKIRSVISHLFHPQHSNNHRPRVLHPEALSYLVLIVVGFSFLLHSAFLAEKYQRILGFQSSVTPEEVVRLTNEERAKYGLRPVVVSRELTQAALAKGQNMFDEQYWAHFSPKGKDPWSFMTEAGYYYISAGENLGRDFSQTENLVAAWMASQTHKANIMNASYTEIGIAVIDGELQGVDTRLVVQMFGTRKAGLGVISSGEETSNLPLAQNTNAVLQKGEYVLSSVDSGTVLPHTSSSLLSPLELSKAFFLAVVFLIILALVYDIAVIGHRKTTRVVGKNLAHILLFIAVAYLIIFFKGGIIG